MGFIDLALSFLEGLLTFISPCILPLIPVYVVYLAGESAMGSQEGKRKLIINSLGFVLGFTIVFMILGATATYVGSFIKDHIFTIRKISGILMILFGLNFAGIIKFNFLNYEKRINYQQSSINFLKAIVFGIVFSLGWSPCIGQFLSVALLMAANLDTLYQGLLLLLSYSLGLGLPFILVAALFDNLSEEMKKLNRHRNIINLLSGIIMIIAGIFTLTGGMQWFTSLW